LPLDSRQLADDIAAAFRDRRPIVPPVARDPAFDVAAAYAVEAELARRRIADGRRIVGRKVGFANKALWRVLKLETLVWAHMYDDTVWFAQNGEASLSIGHMHAPKIEPEIVIKVGRASEPVGSSDVGHAIEWIALGFEIIDCPYPDWKFQPADFVAAYGLHAALVVGEARRLEPEMIEQLATFKVMLSKNGEVVAQGSGRNVLRSPILCLQELSAAAAGRVPPDPIVTGEIISTGTLTESQPMAAGETWSARVDGIDLPALLVRIEPSR
jgi:2-oxo-3-hexenedioate decarboxylase